MTRFEDWDEAVAYYTQVYNDGQVEVNKYLDLGSFEQPIPITSAHPTPVKKAGPAGKDRKKKAQTQNRQNPSASTKSSAASSRRAAKVVDDGTPDDLYATDPKEKMALASAPPKQQLVVDDSSSDECDIIPVPRKSAIPERPIVLVKDSDDPDSRPQRSYPQAKAPALHSDVPVLPRKRPFPLPVPEQRISVDHDFFTSKPVKDTRVAKRTKTTRALTEAPLDMLEDWVPIKLQPLLLSTAMKLAASSGSSSFTISSAQGNSSDEVQFPSSQPTPTNARADVKGKGKARDV